MYRADKRLEIKLRLGEIDRRFAELTVISSKLAGMTAQLDRLRKANETTGRFIDCSCPSSHRRRGDHPSKGVGSGRAYSRENVLDKH